MPRPLRQTIVTLALACVSATAVAPSIAQARHLVPSAEPGAPEPKEVPAPRASETPPTGSTPVAPPSEAPPLETRPRHEHASHLGGRCELSLQQTTAIAVTAGEPVALSGRLSCPETPSAEGQPVTVFERERGTSLTEIATVTTAADGSFALSSPAIAANAVFIARAWHARAARLPVKPTTSVLLSGPPSAGAALLTRAGSAPGLRAHNRYTFSGVVAPAPGGVGVALQRRYAATGERWHTIGFTRTDEAGHFSFTRGFRTGGVLSIRAVAHMHGRVPADSTALTYMITQAQNPQITIQAAANPLPAGSSTTVTGVAPGAAGHKLMLLARTPGHPFAPVATSVAGETGAYSFTVSPAQNTTYRVRDTKTSSTELLLGVLPALTLQAPAIAAQVGQTISITGTLAPVPSGWPVRLEVEHGDGRPRTVVTAPAQASSAFVLSYLFTRAGNYTLRVSTPAGETTAGATSEAFAIVVSAATGA